MLCGRTTMWKNCASYCDNLTSDDKSNYIKKLTLTNGEVLPDPYKNLEWNDDSTILPDVKTIGLVMYLIFTSSVYTQENMRAYKSLEAYNFFLSIYEEQENKYI